MMVRTGVAVDVVETIFEEGVVILYFNFCGVVFIVVVVVAIVVVIVVIVFLFIHYKKSSIYTFRFLYSFI